MVVGISCHRHFGHRRVEGMLDAVHLNNMVLTVAVVRWDGGVVFKLIVRRGSIIIVAVGARAVEMSMKSVAPALYARSGPFVLRISSE